MSAMPIIVMLKLEQLRLQICCRPEEGVVEELAPNCTDQENGYVHESKRPAEPVAKPELLAFGLFLRACTSAHRGVGH